MPEIKNTFTQGKMNKDLDERIVPNGQYRDAMNVQVSTSEGSDVGAVQNILGNTRIGNIVGDGWECVGSIADEKNDVLYSFIAHTNTGRNAIMEYAKDSISGAMSANPVLVDISGDVLKFSGGIITGINVIDEFLLWTDGENEPKKINIQRCKDGTVAFNTHTKLIVDGEEILEKEITTSINAASITTPPNTDIIEILNASQDLEVGDQLIQIENWNFLTSPSAGPNLIYITAISGDIVTLSQNIFTGGGSWATGDVATFHHYTNISEEHITVIKKKPLKPLSVKINPADTDTTPSEKDPLFGKIFPRFSYRYRYEDGEYSAFAPFTDVIFNSEYPFDQDGVQYDENTAYNTKEPYNAGMHNMIESIELTDFVSPDMPDDVVQIDLLYKQENSTVIYVVEIIKNTDTEWSAPGSNITSNYKGKFEVKSENIYAALPENQLLRSWDNVPRTALAQEITGNRLVYGNYVQSYNLGKDNNNIPISPRVSSDYQLRFDGAKHESYYAYEPNLLTNSEFTSDPSIEWDLATGQIHWDSTGGAVDFYDTNPGAPAAIYSKLNQDYDFFKITGTVYRVSFDISNYVQGNLDGRITNGEKGVDFDPTATIAAAASVTTNLYVGGGDWGNFYVDLESDPNPNRRWEIEVVLGDHLDNTFDTNFNGRFYLQSPSGYLFEGTIDNVTIEEGIKNDNIKTFQDGGFPSVKSQRNYQLGVVYGDKYGRETPVFTSSDSSVVIPWEDTGSITPSGSDYPLASFSLQLNTKLTSPHPVWADYYKFFVKETSGEYYNLVMDALWNPTKSDLQVEEHVWISFASSERNKISKDDYIILKKKVGEEGTHPRQIEQENKFRVLDVKNEAPDAIKYNYIKWGVIANDSDSYTINTTGVISAYGYLNANIFPETTKRPIRDASTNPEPIELHIDRDTWLQKEGLPLTSQGEPYEPEEGLYFSFTKINDVTNQTDNQNSKKYKVASLRLDNPTSTNPKYIVRLAEKITDEDSDLAEVDAAGSGFVDGDIDPKITVRFEKKLKKDLESFSGRFFVKILTNSLIKDELENIDELEINYDYHIESAKDVYWHADTITPGAYDIEAGLINNNSAGDLPDSNNVSSVTNLLTGPPNQTTAGVTNTEAAWGELLEEMDNGGSRWFIDRMHMVASQTGEFARHATQGWNAGDLGNAQGGWNGADTGTQYSSSTSVPSGWEKVSHPSGVSSGFESYYYPKINELKPNNPGTGGSNLINGLEGIITTDNSHVGQDGIRRWRNIPWSFNMGVPSSYTPSLDNTYGPVDDDNRYFIHISFLAPGDDLHDGEFECIDSALRLRPSSTYGYSTNDLVWTNLQAIHGGGVFTTTAGGSQPSYSGSFSPVTDKHVWAEMLPTFTGAGGSGGNIHGGFDPGPGNVYQNKHNTQWDLPPSEESFRNNFKVGGKFRFAGDSNKTIYTILSSNYLSPKKVYNHTPWRKMFVASGSNMINHPGNLVGLNNSVEEAATNWANGTNNLGTNNGPDVPDFRTRLLNFGNKNNRRLVYILELDKDPTDAAWNGGYNPVLGGASPTITSTSPAGIEFITRDFELNSGEISQNPAIWETEPKDNVDLDIYYEASQAYPITLTKETNELLAPVGCEVIFIDNPGAIDGYNGIITNSIYISSWINEDTFKLSEDINSSTTGAIPGIATLINYIGKQVQFIREDGSYTTGIIEEMLQSNATFFAWDTVRISTSTKTGLGWYNCFSFGNGIESNRIRDDFNAMTITNGVRANTTLDRPYEEEHRKSGMIYSGIYNSTSGVNNLNQFVMSDKITKDLNPTFGSIQKLFTRRISLIAFCEDRIIGITANKSALYNADGNPQLVATDAVLGDANPFVGDYGISKNPESFAKESYRAYFTDKQRGAVLRLSMDGLTPISDAGMSDWFKDELKKPQYNIIGSYDNYKKDYNLTLDGGEGTPVVISTTSTVTPPRRTSSPPVIISGDSYTLTFSEDVRGWTSFKSFIPESGVSMSGDYYTFKGGKCYKHHEPDPYPRNTFYVGSVEPSTIKFLLNESPLVIKNYNTLNYDGNENWVCDNISTDQQSGSVTEFIEKEGKWFNYIKGDVNAALDAKAFNFQGIGTASSIQYNIQ